ncbi:SEC14-like protein 2 [Folsomia candida]|uniref:SEC14-like protein 2 n=1 Tax=Folsomia candida TaxID=158441 RepID=UPI000B8FBF20|nr:SEC14-like protein 2 [Folsomia candida]
MAKPSPHELEIIGEVRERISDLRLSDEYLQPKNLVRFVRARNEQLDQIEDMIRKNACYHDTYDTEIIMRWVPLNSIVEGFPYRIVGFDNLGGLVIVFPVGTWVTAAVSGKREEFTRWAIQVLEKTWALMRFNSKGKDYIPQFCAIIDLEGFGWRHLTCYDAIQGFLNMFKVFEANYPDTLRSAFIINEMPIFGTFWRLLRPIISDVTHAKISFLGSDKSLWAKSIGQLAKRDQFPEKYGGDQPPNYTVNLDEIGLNEFIFQNGNGEF